MIKFKIFLCTLLITAMSLVYPLHSGMAANKPQVSVPPKINNNKIVLDKSIKDKDSQEKFDNIIIDPKLNIDPKMVISGNPNIDPGFLLEYPQKIDATSPKKK